MKVLVKVTENELAQILYKMPNNAKFANIVQFTDAKLKKTNNPFLGVRKLSILSVLFNSDYEKGVLKQLDKEEKEPTEYKKGVNTMPIEFGINNRIIGKFEGKNVLQYRPFENSYPRSKFLTSGAKLIDKHRIEAFLPTVSKAQNQGTEKEILWRKLYLSNLVKITVNSITYKIIR
jgi:hypothetical protein